MSTPSEETPELYRTGIPHDPQTVNILSWNILAEAYTADGKADYAYVPPKDLQWSVRCKRLLQEIVASDADVITLQEVMFNHFEVDLTTPLAGAGYDGLMQNDKRRTPDHPQGVATFWKRDKLTLMHQAHRSRTMTVILRDEMGRQLAVVNCHLEGDPVRWCSPLYLWFCTCGSAAQP
jgi:mRNA deadenylase 3'-5' endonuclease subunit Ccr4